MAGVNRVDGLCFIFFFQAEDGIRDKLVTGVQTCALPIYIPATRPLHRGRCTAGGPVAEPKWRSLSRQPRREIGRASCRGRGEISVVAVSLKKKKKKKRAGRSSHKTTNEGDRYRHMRDTSV